MRYPKFLTPGGTIGLVAPSFGCPAPFSAALELAQGKLFSLGHELAEGPNCRSSHGLGISASPEECAWELTDGYTSSYCDVLISCSGGELMCRILDHLDLERIAQAEPKWFMGFSDNTNFTFLLTTLFDTASIYGPCALSFGMEPWHPCIQDAYDLICGKKLEVGSYTGYQSKPGFEGAVPGAPYDIDTPLSLAIYPEGGVEFSGRLLGGCLDVLINLCGTEYDQVAQFADRYQEDGILWFLEACDLNVFGICRALWQLEHAGWFQHVSGFLIGRPLNGNESMGMDRYTAVLEILGKYEVPVIMDVDLGHVPPAMPLICGSYAHVWADGNEMTVSMELRE
jgi:muramoyltetrapeptide carboxypeptidase LdcA involved in peptidoglycan recycling